MSNRDHLSNMLRRIEYFLSQYSRVIDVLATLGRINSRSQSAIYECYSFSELALQLKKSGWDIDVCNIQTGEFRFKTSALGDPNNFSYYIIDKNGVTFEVRQQISVKGKWGRYTPDISIIRKSSRFSQGNRGIYYLENSDIENFIECKHLEPYPMSCVQFVGILYVLNRWGRENFRERRKFPAMMFYSNFSQSKNVNNIIRRMSSDRYANYIFDGIQPDSPRLEDLQEYLKKYP